MTSEFFHLLQLFVELCSRPSFRHFQQVFEAQHKKKNNLSIHALFSDSSSERAQSSEVFSPHRKTALDCNVQSRAKPRVEMVGPFLPRHSQEKAALDSIGTGNTPS